MQNIILHLDMNSYFASVEQQDHPDWRGRPLGVCEHLGGIIIAASREAKQWGIKTGTPVWEAKKLYPKIILVHTRAEAYRQYARKFLKVVGDYTDKVEKYSIDECFFDVTRQCNISKTANQLISLSTNKLTEPFEEAVKIALEIKKRFKTEVGDFLTCSIGIANNKALAKIASDLKKPDGLVVIVDSQDAKTKMQNLGAVSFTKSDLYYQLKLIDIPGIGRRQEKNLSQLGIKTLADLRDFPRSHLVARFGTVMGYHLHNLGQLKGTWKEQVFDEQKIKSMGHMYTLPREFRKPEFFLPVLYKLCEMVGRRLRKKNLMGNIISCFCHNKDYEGFGDSKKLGYLLQDGREIFLEATKLLKQHAGAEGFAGIKLIGVTVAGLEPYVNQLSLFGQAEQQKRLLTSLDKINNKYGEFTVMRAEMFKAGKVFRDSVGFGRMKEL